MKNKIYVFLLLILFSCSTEQNKFSENQWIEKVENTDVKKLYAVHARDGKFFNPWLPMKEKSIFTVINWKLSKSRSYTTEETDFIPKVKKNLFTRIKKSGKKNFIVWIGHNTFLIRMNMQYWITDPMFSKRALLPARKIDVPMSIAQLKKLTGHVNVIITHNHYDHLDKSTIDDIKSIATFYVPLGIDKNLKSWGVKKVRAMDWWDSLNLKGKSNLICLPAQHWSRRIMDSVNSSLWAGFLLTIKNRRFLIGGDSGYFKGYREFGRKFKNIDYAFMPLTAYHPRWFMHYAHVNAEEAVRGFQELRAKFFIPTQWGTFHLGDNPPGYPVIDLKKIIEKRKLKKNKFKILLPGELLFIPKE